MTFVQALIDPGPRRRQLRSSRPVYVRLTELVYMQLSQGPPPADEANDFLGWTTHSSSARNWGAHRRNVRGLDRSSAALGLDRPDVMASHRVQRGLFVRGVVGGFDDGRTAGCVLMNDILSANHRRDCLPRRGSPYRRKGARQNVSSPALPAGNQRVMETWTWRWTSQTPRC